MGKKNPFAFVWVSPGYDRTSVLISPGVRVASATAVSPSTCMFQNVWGLGFVISTAIHTCFTGQIAHEGVAA